MKLPQCINSTTCLSRRPVVMRVEKGCSADVFVDNAAYRKFLRSKFDVTPVDMETAAVALVCLQQRAPFVAFRALSDRAGGGSSESNAADVFSSLAAGNATAPSQWPLSSSHNCLETRARRYPFHHRVHGLTVKKVLES